MWSRNYAGKQISHSVTHPTRHQVPIWMRSILGRNNPANKLWRFVTQRLDLPRIERHRGRRAGIAGEDFGNPGGKPHVAIEAAFDLDQHRCSPGDQLAELAECHDAFAAVAEQHVLELGCAEPI